MTNRLRNVLGMNLTMLSILLVFAGCDKPKPEEATLPSDFQVQVEVDDENKGMVTLKATADNANFFSYTFEEAGTTHYEESIDGSAVYTYDATGTYEIIARAHTTAADFVEESLEVMIDLSAADPDSSDGYISPESYEGYNLVWRDEFEGNALNTDDWNYEIGTGNNGWGNNEWQYYLEENTSVADGRLTITAKEETFNNNNYTSSRLTTEGKQSFKYGRVDIRAIMPYGQGIWPALWMLGENFSTIGWPRCGEIDIMEMIGGGQNDAVTHGTIHWDNAGTKSDFGGNKSLEMGRLADEYHVYSIIWDETSIRWLLDGTVFFTADITDANMEEFHEEFFFIMNIAVGGNWPGYPDATTEFPQTMHVDYIRVFQEE